MTTYHYFIRLRLNNSHRCVRVHINNWEDIWKSARRIYDLDGVLILKTEAGEFIADSYGNFSIIHETWKHLKYWQDINVYICRKNDNFKPLGYKCGRCGKKNRNHHCVIYESYLTKLIKYLS
jgi:hypothetical protein